jgi:multidrug efflux pump subunit AcrA (membrane-fusion protein)
MSEINGGTGFALGLAQQAAAAAKKLKNSDAVKKGTALAKEGIEKGKQMAKEQAEKLKKSEEGAKKREEIASQEREENTTDPKNREEAARKRAENAETQLAAELAAEDRTAKEAGAKRAEAMAKEAKNLAKESPSSVETPAGPPSPEIIDPIKEMERLKMEIMANKKNTENLLAENKRLKKEYDDTLEEALTVETELTELKKQQTEITKIIEGLRSQKEYSTEKYIVSKIDDGFQIKLKT